MEIFIESTIGLICVCVCVFTKYKGYVVVTISNCSALRTVTPLSSTLHILHHFFQPQFGLQDPTPSSSTVSPQPSLLCLVLLYKTLSSVKTVGLVWTCFVFSQLHSGLWYYSLCLESHSYSLCWIFIHLSKPLMNVICFMRPSLIAPTRKCSLLPGMSHLVYRCLYKQFSMCCGDGIKPWMFVKL